MLVLRTYTNRYPWRKERSYEKAMNMFEFFLRADVFLGLRGSNTYFKKILKVLLTKYIHSTKIKAKAYSKFLFCLTQKLSFINVTNNAWNP